MHCFPPITVSRGDIRFEKRLPVGESLLIYNKLQNFISQKLKKLFEPKFQQVFLYTYTASSGNLSSLALYKALNGPKRKIWTK